MYESDCVEHPEGKTLTFVLRISLRRVFSLGYQHQYRVPYGARSGHLQDSGLFLRLCTTDNSR
jgi:hypothetical protein